MVTQPRLLEFKVPALPAPGDLFAHAIYRVKGPADTKVTTYITDAAAVAFPEAGATEAAASAAAAAASALTATDAASTVADHAATVAAGVVTVTASESAAAASETAAAASATAASTSSGQAGTSATTAVAAAATATTKAAEAAASAASINLPSIGVGDGLKYLQVKSDRTGYQFGTPSGGGSASAVSPIDYGAIGDGATNDTTAMQSAITAAVGLVLDGGGRTYRIDGSLSIPSNTTMVNMVIDASNAPNSTNTLSVLGSLGSALALNANVSPQSLTVTLASTSGLAVGDYVFLSSNDTFCLSTKHGEIQRIKSLVADTSVTFAGPILGTYTTANSVSLKKMTLKENIRIDGVTVIGSTAVGSNGSVGARFTYARGVNLSGCKFLRWHYAAVIVQGVIDLIAGSTEFLDCNGTGLGYGFDLGWSSNINFGDIVARGCRHVVTGGGDTYPIRNFVVGDIAASDCLGAVIDSHEGVVDGICGNVTASFSVESSSEDAITMQGSRISIGDVSLSGNYRTGLFFQHYGPAETYETQYFKVGCVAAHGGGSYSNAVISIMTQTTVPLDHVVIGGITGKGARGIIVESAQSDIRQVDIGPSRFKVATMSGGSETLPAYYGVYLLASANGKIDRVNLSNCHITSTTASGYYCLFAVGSAWTSGHGVEPGVNVRLINSTFVGGEYSTRAIDATVSHAFHSVSGTSVGEYAISGVGSYDNIAGIGGNPDLIALEAISATNVIPYRSAANTWSTLAVASGSFTPTIKGAATAGSVTYSTQYGTYLRIGSACFVQVRVVWTGLTGAVGQLQLAGLPVTSGEYAPFSVYSDGLDYGGSAKEISCLSVSGSTVIGFYQSDSAGGAATSVDAAAANNSAGSIAISGWYAV